VKNNYLGVYASLLVLLSFGSIAQKISATPFAIDNINQDVAFPSASQFSNNKITYKIIPAVIQTWCYDILAEGKIMIHQPSASELHGNEGFKTKAAAKKAADLVIHKIKNGEMPPSITKVEMQKIGAL
jgi:hypothetical protein